MTWTAVADATGYNVVGGSLDILRSSNGDFAAAVDRCLGNQLVTTSREDPAVPAADSASWYLVRAVNCASLGTYDFGGEGQQGPRDAEINGACP